MSSSIPSLSSVLVVSSCDEHFGAFNTYDMVTISGLCVMFSQELYFCVACRAYLGLRIVSNKLCDRRKLQNVIFHHLSMDKAFNIC